MAIKLVALAALALSVVACSSKKSDEPPAPTAAPAPGPAAPTPATPTPSAADRPAVATMPADFPPECAAYAELIDKLRTCDRLGGARDGLLQGYDTVRSSWSTVPADRRGEVAAQCKVQADSLRSAAAATCGW